MSVDDGTNTGVTKFLSIVGTAAMFLVGGGILVHSIAVLHHATDGLMKAMGLTVEGLITSAAPIIMEGAVGLLAGALVLVVLSFVSKLLPSKGKTH